MKTYEARPLIIGLVLYVIWHWWFGGMKDIYPIKAPFNLSLKVLFWNRWGGPLAALIHGSPKKTAIKRSGSSISVPLYADASYIMWVGVI